MYKKRTGSWNKGLTGEKSHMFGRPGHTKGRIIPAEERLRRSKISKERGIMPPHKKGQESSHWKGGKIARRGYVSIYSPNHPHKDSLGYVYEHRLIIEEQLGRYLNKTERVHHINGRKNDNRIENLYLFSNQAEHAKHHIGERERTASGKLTS